MIRHLNLFLHFAPTGENKLYRAVINFTIFSSIFFFSLSLSLFADEEEKKFE
jgi:hypothetical protein